MIQRTVNYRARPIARTAPQSADAAFPLTFLAVAFGVIAGIALAGIVVPIQAVVPAVVRTLTGV